VVNEGIELKQQITAWQNLIIFSEIVINFLRFIIIIFLFYYYKISRNNCFVVCVTHGSWFFWRFTSSKSLRESNVSRVFIQKFTVVVRY